MVRTPEEDQENINWKAHRKIKTQDTRNILELKACRKQWKVNEDVLEDNCGDYKQEDQQHKTLLTDIQKLILLQKISPVIGKNQYKLYSKDSLVWLFRS